MEKPVLFINACVRGDSRTLRLAKELLRKLERPVDELKLSEVSFPVVNEAFLTLRDRLIADREFDHPLFRAARQFSEAETVVIAAPFWDLSFPASLKQYFEQINVVGITFRYSEEGIPVGLCRAEKLYYVTTAGGNYVPEAFGFGYVRALAEGFYGIREVVKIEASGLDLVGADVDAIIEKAEKSIAAMTSKAEGKEADGNESVSGGRMLLVHYADL